MTDFRAICETSRRHWAAIEAFAAPRLSAEDLQRLRELGAALLDAIEHAYTAHITDREDAAFGRGHRYGHEAGRTEGWTQRDTQAEQEQQNLRRVNDALAAAYAAVDDPAEPSPTTDQRIRELCASVSAWTPPDGTMH